VIDLRTLKPLDMETVAASVKKTGRVVGVTEHIGRVVYQRTRHPHSGGAL